MPSGDVARSARSWVPGFRGFSRMIVHSPRRLASAIATTSSPSINSTFALGAESPATAVSPDGSTRTTSKVGMFDGAASAGALGPVTLRPTSPLGGDATGASGSARAVSVGPAGAASVTAAGGSDAAAAGGSAAAAAGASVAMPGAVAAAPSAPTRLSSLFGSSALSARATTSGLAGSWRSRRLGCGGGLRLFHCDRRWNGGRDPVAGTEAIGEPGEHAQSQHHQDQCDQPKDLSVFHGFRPCRDGVRSAPPSIARTANSRGAPSFPPAASLIPTRGIGPPARKSVTVPRLDGRRWPVRHSPHHGESYKCLCLLRLGGRHRSRPMPPRRPNSASCWRSLASASFMAADRSG